VFLIGKYTFLVNVCFYFIVLDIVHCLRYTRYVWHFRRWLCFYLQVIGCYCTNRYVNKMITSHLNTGHDLSLKEDKKNTDAWKWSKVKVKLSHYFHAGIKRERRYSSYSFLTSVVNGDEWSVSCSGCTLSPGKDPLFPLYRRLGGPQSWSGHRLEEEYFSCAGDRTLVIQSSQTLYWVNYPTSQCETKVLWKILLYKMDEVGTQFGKLHNKEVQVM
jgi:hypothetical protein